jgi:soluble lytic murein transglycosylase-like protein
MPNNNYDELFDRWGQALNVNPQLGKTVFHIESSGGKNTGPGVPGDPDSPIGPMQMRPSTAAQMAQVLKLDPKAINLHDMGWAVPLSLAYIAEGLTKTDGDGAHALAYYYSGSADPKKWGPKTQDYMARGGKLYPSMQLQLPQDVAQAGQ